LTYTTAPFLSRSVPVCDPHNAFSVMIGVSHASNS
jgi:hypothetical protein